MITAAPQEAYVWASVIDATKTAMNIRFQLLPYMYTLFYLAHNTGSTVMRALAWEFPNDPSLAAADRQFLLGPAILVTPVLMPGATTVDGVFPGVGQGGTCWYDWYTQAAVNATAGQNKTIEAPLGHIPVFIRGGNVIPTQEPAMTTRDARKNPWGVIAALDLEGAASGSLYIDDGESVMPNATLYVDVSASPFDFPFFVFGCLLALNRLSHQAPSDNLMHRTVHRLQLLPLRLRPRHLRRHQPARQHHHPRRPERSLEGLVQQHARRGQLRQVRCEQ